MHNHSHTPTLEPAPATRGSVIRWAGGYDTLVNLLTLGHANLLREQSVALGNLSAGLNVLEVGCGTGEIALRARKQVGESGTVMGIDASPEMINVARNKALDQHLQIEYRVGIIEALPYPDNSFDVVFSSMMMHHLPSDVKRAGLQEIYRVLKPQGRLVVVDMNRPSGGAGKIMLLLSMHGSLKQGVQDLVPLVAEFGFTQIETKSFRIALLGYLRASKKI